MKYNFMKKLYLLMKSNFLKKFDLHMKYNFLKKLYLHLKNFIDEIFSPLSKSCFGRNNFYHLLLTN